MKVVVLKALNLAVEVEEAKSASLAILRYFRSSSRPGSAQAKSVRWSCDDF